MTDLDLATTRRDIANALLTACLLYTSDAADE